MRGTRFRQAGRLKGAAAVALGLSAVLAATALAASGNRVTAIPPTNAQANVNYSITAKGHAKKSETLYVFIDYIRCAATPAREHYKHGAPGFIWFHVKGDFKKKSTWHSGLKRKDHACAYLVKASEPKNPSRGVLAHGFATYRIH